MNREKRKIIRCAFLMACIGALLSLPFLAGAGSLEPPPEATDSGGNPHPTMKTLNEIPPTWSQTLSANDGDSEGCDSSRFKCVLNREAVLDLETGLVWMRSPVSELRYYAGIEILCSTQVVGNRMGWRPPTIEELSSLVDITRNNPTLPSGHPFIFPSYNQWRFYFSSSTDFQDIDEIWVVDFFRESDTDDPVFMTGKGGSWGNLLCVRGSRTADPVFGGVHH